MQNRTAEKIPENLHHMLTNPSIHTQENRLKKDNGIVLYSNQNSPRNMQIVYNQNTVKSPDSSTYYGMQRQSMNDYFSENSQNRNSLNRMSYGVQIESAKNEPNVVKIGEMEKNGKERELTRNATERKVPKIQGLQKTGSQKVFFHYQNASKQNININEVNESENGQYRYNQHQNEIFWENKYIQTQNKVQVLVQRLQVIYQDIYIIQKHFETVSNEQEWNQLRVKYTNMISKFNQCKDIVDTMIEQDYGDENEEDNCNGNGNGVFNNVWEGRYYELVQQHQLLMEQLQKRKQSQQDFVRTSIKVQEEVNKNRNKNIQLQNALNYLHAQYKQLQNSYKSLNDAYNQVLMQLQQRQAEDEFTPQEMLGKMQSQLKDAQTRIMCLQTQLNHKARSQSEDNQNNINNNINLRAYEQKIGELTQHNNGLVNNINCLHKQLEKYDEELNKKETIIQRQNQRNRKIQSQYHKYKQEYEEALTYKTKLKQAIDMLQYREREIDNLKDIITEQKNICIELQEKRALYQLQRAQMSNKLIALQTQVHNKNQMMSEYESNRKNSHIANADKYEQKCQQLQQQIAQKNRKIKHLLFQIDDLTATMERKLHQKDRIIQEIQLIHKDEEEKLLKKVSTKENKNKAIQQKTKLLEHQLSNRNLQISRFKLQKTNTNEEEKRDLNLKIEKKNNQLQQLKRQKEEKNIQAWEQEQQCNTLQVQLNNKSYQLNKLKRKIQEIGQYQIQIKALTATIKKKNQEINEHKLNTLQLEQYRHDKENFEKEKRHLNFVINEQEEEYTKYKQIIKHLQQRIQKLTTSQPNQIVVKFQDKAKLQILQISKTKEAQVKKLQYELDLIETHKETLQRNIKELNMKIAERDSIHSKYRMENEGIIIKYDQYIKKLQRENKQLKRDNESAVNSVNVLNVKTTSMEKAQEEGMKLFDKEINNYKQKKLQSERVTTQVKIEYELLKEEKGRVQKKNAEQVQRIQKLQRKLQQKNQQIQIIKDTFKEKEVKHNQNYKETVSSLDNQLKISGFKIKNMESQIGNLNQKIKNTQNQKNIYKGRLYTQTKQDNAQDNIHERRLTDLSNIQFKCNKPNNMHYYSHTSSLSSQLFENKIIYELKKENEYLRKELILNYNSAHMKHPQREILQFQYSSNSLQEDIAFHKSKNKQLERRNNQLLKANQLLNNKLLSYKERLSNQHQIQYYKDEISQIQKSKAIITQKVQHLHHQKAQLKAENKAKEKEIQGLREQVQQLTLNITQNREQLRSRENANRKLKSQYQFSEKEVKYLKEQWLKEKKEKENLSALIRRVRDKKNRHKGQIREESQQSKLQQMQNQ